MLQLQPLLLADFLNTDACIFSTTPFQVLEAQKGETRKEKEIMALRKIGAQKEAEARALQSDVDRQAELVAKLKAENDRIRSELGHSAKSDVCRAFAAYTSPRGCYLFYTMLALVVVHLSRISFNNAFPRGCYLFHTMLVLVVMCRSFTRVMKLTCTPCIVHA